MQAAIDKLPDLKFCTPHFDTLLALCAEKNAYIVGGAIRDALTGRRVTDLDLIFPEDPTPVARKFARQIGGHWFWLDRERLQSRVVVHDDDSCPHYDFALFRAPDLERDLLDRDFTINAMALPLSAELSPSSLFDPCCGLKDLQQGILRMVGARSLANDPLRIVKGVRHATVLGLEIESATLQTMRFEIAGLDLIAPERIRQEFWKLLADKQGCRGLLLLQESGAGRQLFGEGFYLSLPCLIGQLESCRRVWQQLVQKHACVDAWLSAEVEQGLSNETLLLSVFLQMIIDPQLPMIIAQRWKLSRNARANIAAIIALDKTVLREFKTVARTRRAFAWWSVRCRVEPKLLFLVLSVMGDQADISEFYDWVPIITQHDNHPPTDLVDGHWLIGELGFKEGPEMSKALELLRNAEISGLVSDTEEAHHFLLQHYHNKH